MAGKDPEGARAVRGAKRDDAVGIDDDGERRGDREPDRASPFAAASLARASSRSPTM